MLAALQDRWAQGGFPVEEEGVVGANMETPASAPQRLGNNNTTLASLSSPPLMMSRGHWRCHCHHFVGVVFATVAGRGAGIDIIDGRCGGAWYCASACNCTSPTAATMTMMASAAGGQALRRCGGAGASVPSLGGNAIRFSFAFTIHIAGRATAIAPCARSKSLMSVHRDDCLGTKAPVIAVSAAYKLVVNATRCTFTSHFNVGPF